MSQSSPRRDVREAGQKPHSSRSCTSHSITATTHSRARSQVHCSRQRTHSKCRQRPCSNIVLDDSGSWLVSQHIAVTAWAGTCMLSCHQEHLRAKDFEELPVTNLCTPILVSSQPHNSMISVMYRNDIWQPARFFWRAIRQPCKRCCKVAACAVVLCMSCAAATKYAVHCIKVSGSPFTTYGCGLPYRVFYHFDCKSMVDMCW